MSKTMTITPDGAIIHTQTLLELFSWRDLSSPHAPRHYFFDCVRRGHIPAPDAEYIIYSAARAEGWSVEYEDEMFRLLDETVCHAMPRHAQAARHTEVDAMPRGIYIPPVGGDTLAAYRLPVARHGVTVCQTTRHTVTSREG